MSNYVETPKLIGLKNRQEDHVYQNRQAQCIHTIKYNYKYIHQLATI